MYMIYGHFSTGRCFCWFVDNLDRARADAADILTRHNRGSYDQCSSVEIVGTFTGATVETIA